MDSQLVQRIIYEVLFMFMSLMKSLPMVARTEVLRRNTTRDWSVKARTSCAGRPSPLRGSVRPPIPCTEGSSTLKPWRRRHSQGGSHSDQEAIHKLEREEGDLQREINHLDGSTHKWRRRKTSSEGWPWSTVLCLAPWWGNLLIRPWVVIDLEM
jgi:hypothetical protein